MIDTPAGRKRKKPRRWKRPLWRPGDTWEVNIDRLVAARHASKWQWTSARRRIHGRKVKAGHKRNERKRQKIASAEWQKKNPRKRGARPAAGRRHVDRILRAMLPGEWCGEPDLRALTGMRHDSISPVLRQRLEPSGLIERGRNADRQERRYPVAADRQGAPLTFLWRLTAAGEAARALALILE